MYTRICISPAGVHRYSPYGIGTGPVWLKNLNCIGTEQQLFNCPVINTLYIATLIAIITTMQQCSVLVRSIVLLYKSA